MTALDFFSSVKRQNVTLFIMSDLIYLRAKINFTVYKDTLDVQLLPGATLTIEKDYPVTYFKEAYYLKSIKIRICDDEKGGFKNGL